MNLSLRYKINGAILVTFVFIAIIFTIVQLPLERHRLELETNRVKLLLQTLVERDGEELANEIFDDRITALQIRLKEITRIHSILYACIFDMSGTLLASAGSHAPEQPVTREFLVETARSAHIQTFGDKKRKGLIFARPLGFLGENTGYILMLYSLEELVSHQRMSFFIFAGLLTATLVTMLVLLNIALSKAILEPILHLNESTRAIVRGNYDKAIPMEQNDEIGNLSQNFDQMRSAVKEKINDIEEMTEKYRRLYQQAPAMLCSVDGHGRIVEVNDLLMETLGLSRDQLIGWQSFDFLLAKGSANIITFLEQVLKNENTVISKPYQILSKKDIVLDTLVSVFAQKDSKGKIIQATLSIQDITEKVKAENALRKREQQLRLLTDNMVDVIIQIDAHLNLVYVSPSAERVFGIPPEDLIGKSGLPYIHPEDVEKISNKISDVKKHKITALLIEYRWRHANGKYLWVESAARVLYDPSGKSNGAIFGTRNITESKKANEEKQKLEKKLIQSQKMEAIGTLAGGIAHDFNNIRTLDLENGLFYFHC